MLHTFLSKDFLSWLQVGILTIQSHSSALPNTRQYHVQGYSSLNNIYSTSQSAHLANKDCPPSLQELLNLRQLGSIIRPITGDCGLT
jgi:hypothetical protein